MSDTTTIKPPPAPAAPRPRGTARPTVSVRPVAVGALNAAVIGGATVVTAGGGLVLAAAGAGAAAVAAASAGRKSSRARANKQARTNSGGGGLLGSPGRSSGARSGGLPRAGRSSAGSPGRASGSGGRSSGAGRGGAGRPAGSKPSPSLRGRGGAGGPLGGRNRSSAGTPGTGGHRRAGSKPGSSSRSPLTADKVAAARRKLANRRQPGPRLSDAIRSATTPAAGGKRPTPRQAWSSARKAVTGSSPKRRGPVRQATAGLAAAGLAAGKAAWDARRRRKKAAAARKAKTARINARQTKGGVGTTVRRPPSSTQQTSTQRRPAPQPVPRRQQSGTRPAPAPEGLITMIHPLLAISEDFLAAARRNQPEGMLQVTAEAHILPAIMENFVAAMKIRFDQAQDHPLHPAIKDMYGVVHKAQVAVQSAAEEIGPTIERVHEDELKRLRNPKLRGDESMWDVSRNRGAA